MIYLWMSHPLILFFIACFLIVSCHLLSLLLLLFLQAPSPSPKGIAFLKTEFPSCNKNPSLSLFSNEIIRPFMIWSHIWIMNSVSMSSCPCLFPRVEARRSLKVTGSHLPTHLSKLSSCSAVTFFPRLLSSLKFHPLCSIPITMLTFT